MQLGRADEFKTSHLQAMTSIFRKINVIFFVFLTGMTMNLATATVLQICYCTCTPRSNLARFVTTEQTIPSFQRTYFIAKAIASPRRATVLTYETSLSL